MEESVVTGAMLARFLKARGVSDDCPACGAGSGMSISVYDPAGDLGGDAPAVNLRQHIMWSVGSIIGMGALVLAIVRFAGA